MKDQRAVEAFKGPAQSYGMELERRVSAAQDDLASNTTAISANTTAIEATAADLADLAATVAGLSFALNTEHATITSNMSTSSSSFVDMFAGSTDVTITTTGGDLLVLVSGGGLYNNSNTEHSYIGINVDGTDYTINHMRQNAATAADLDNTEHPWGGFLYLTGVSAASHTAKLRIRSSAGGTAEIRTGSRTSILAIEVPQ